MFETVAWISIIIGFILIVSVSLAAMLITRRREQQAPPAADFDEAVRQVDEASDAALNEINKTAELILKDIDEKYQTLLFLYDLLDEKQKKASSAVRTPAGVPQLPVRQIQKSVPAPAPQKKAFALSARHERIIELYTGGMSPADIAKELDMGKGEVKLIIGLAERG